MAIYSGLLCVYTLPHILFSLPPCCHLPWDFKPLVLQLCCKYLTSHSLICLFSPTESFPLLIKLRWGDVRPLSDSLPRAAARAVLCSAAPPQVASQQRMLPACQAPGSGGFLSVTREDQGPSATSSYREGNSKQGRCHSTSPG